MFSSQNDAGKRERLRLTRRYMKKATLACILAWILGATPLAAEPVPAEIVLARVLFAEARAAEDAKDWALAAAKLREAIAIKETGGLRFHLAYCEEQQGLLVEALVDYERSDDLTAGTNEEFRAQLPAKRESLRRRIPTITLLAPPKPSNPTLTVDGHAMPPAVIGKPIPLNPGRHTLVLSAPEHSAFTTQVSLNETDAVVANAILTPLREGAPVSTLEPAPIAPQTAPMRQSPAELGGNSGLRTRTYVLIAEAAVALGGAAAGIGFALHATSQEESAEHIRNTLPVPTDENPKNYCSLRPGDANCADLNGALDGERRDRLVSTIGFIGAGVAAASFVGTLVLWRPSAKVAIVPSFTPGFAIMSLSGHF
jgi:hypothetical protein